jgi:cyclic pyranopterin phosphate synthase
MIMPHYPLTTGESDTSADTPAFDYLRVSVTDRCQLNCAYCRPLPQPLAEAPRLLTGPELVACCAAICGAAPIRKIRLSGGEPLLRADLPELIAALTRLPGDPEVTLTTNGVLLAERAVELAAAGLSRLNVSLDTADHASYERLTKSPALGRVLRGLEAARAAGFCGTKLNAVLLSSLQTCELQALLAVAADHGAILRLIELMPLGLDSAFYAAQHVPFAEALRRVSAAAHLVTQAAPDDSNPHHRLLATMADGRAVTVELIAPMSRPFCHDCRRVRLSCDGQLLPCLLSPARLAFVDKHRRPPDLPAVRALLHRCAALKQRADDLTTQRMWAIGG